MAITLAVLASTNATDSQAIIDAIAAGQLDASIACFIANKECGALERAKKHNIEAILIPSKGKKREEFDKLVDAELKKRSVNLILAIGYMRYFSPWFVKEWENRIMNIHPSLLPAFAGGMDKDVHKEILEHGCKVTGCTLHFVDEGADTGPIIVQKAVPIETNETIGSLKQKVQAAEQEAILEGIKLFASGKLKVDGRVVRIS